MNVNKQYETILDTKEQLLRINRILHLNSKATSCNNCDTVYFNVGKKYFYKGEELCPVCDADIIDRFEARKQGYKAS